MDDSKERERVWGENVFGSFWNGSSELYARWDGHCVCGCDWAIGVVSRVGVVRGLRGWEGYEIYRTDKR